MADEQQDQLPGDVAAIAPARRVNTRRAVVAVEPAGRRHKSIRRSPDPQFSGLLDSPFRNLVGGLLFILLVTLLATGAYMSQGWSFREAFYMVVVTLYTVGYSEVHPVDSTALYAITICLIILGCTGMIFLTGVVVQFITLNQMSRIPGQKTMNKQIEQIEGHVVVCGFGRLGVVLARALRRSSAGFVVIDDNEALVAEARAAGYLSIHGDPASEDVLLSAGVLRANALASVLANDALNVFITLSARALNPDLMIVARGDKPSTESKLLQAGADKVVLPDHIGGERIAELFLFQETARFMDSLERSHGFQRALRNFGMDAQVMTAAPRSPVLTMTLGAIERQARGAFFIVQINRRDGDVHTSPPENATLEEGDAIMAIGRPDRFAAMASLFEPRQHTGARSL